MTRSCCGRKDQSLDDFEQNGYSNGHAKKGAEKAPGYREVFNPQSNLNLLAYSLLALHSIAFDQLNPVFIHTPVADEAEWSDMVLPFKFVTGFGLDVSYSRGRSIFKLTVASILALAFSLPCVCRFVPSF